ncbi:MAG: ComF family protein [Verrucomicrobiales bacterium]|nr:ComF family protein [Verrucomicrobiales bacterium]
MGELVKQIKEGLLGLIYPRLCFGCELPLGECADYLCETCAQQLLKIRAPYCEVCGQPYAGAMQMSFECSNCSGRHLNFDFAHAAYQSKGLARVLVHRFKYHGHFYLANLLGQMLNEALEDERLSEVGAEGGDDWVLVPVPLHSRRLREREYNQAEEMCRVLARLRGLPQVHALRRIRYTRRQAMLDRAERLKNLQGAFVISTKDRERKKIAGKCVLLVDDVLTTGATASACAQILFAAGALKVVVITVVRG